MHRSVLHYALGVTAFSLLAAGQYSLWRQQRSTEATIERVAEKLEGSAHAVGVPRLTFQPTLASCLSKQDLRTVLREELAANQACVPASSANEELPTPLPPTPENQQAFQSAQRMVQNAISAHVWSESDATELRRLLPLMTPEQHQTVLQTLAPAINSQQVRVEVAGPAF